VLSFSGQFLVSRMGEEASTAPAPVFTDTNLLRLKPAVLAISVERFKISLWRQLGFPAGAPWSGKVYFDLHPARSSNDIVTIAATPFLDHWNYRVALPDRLSKIRFARALSSVLLLEIANREAPRNGACAEVPFWLVDGLAQQVLAADGDKVLLSAPAKPDVQMAVNRLSENKRGWDPLISARKVLQNSQPLTFDELSWPTDDELAGLDGGVYYASTQLFQAELLELKNGPARLRAMLAELPAHLNWQTAFYHAYGADFKNPLDVEKWWALRTVVFAQSAPGPRWTTDVSVVRLQELLSVPVEFRGGSNALPGHAEISLQNALQNLGPDQRDLVIRTKSRDLALVELRLAAPFGALADAYRQTLADFLGDLRKTQNSVVNKHGAQLTVRTTVQETVRQLNALDLRRRNAEIRAFAVGPSSASPGALAQ
jgi:hypothetical protein